MPALANARHERFAQELAKGTAQVKAHEICGFKASAANRFAGASRLAAKVRPRVDELRAAAAPATAAREGEIVADVIVSRASILRELDLAGQMAIKHEMPSAMVAASLAKAKIMGLDKPPDEASNVHYSISDRPMTSEEWAAEYGKPRAEERTSDEAALLAKIRAAKARGYDVGVALDRVLGKPLANGHAGPPQKAAGAPELATDNPAPRPTEPSRMPAIRPRRVLS